MDLIKAQDDADEGDELRLSRVEKELEELESGVCARKRKSKGTLMLSFRLRMYRLCRGTRCSTSQ